MAHRNSPLLQFISDALMDAKYPLFLYWIDRNEGIFCLECLLKSNRNWTSTHSKIFEDYHNLKPRKSADKRQRFLVAMQHSPYIEPLEDISKKEKKYYKFRTHSTASVNSTDECANSSPAIEDVAMQETSVACTVEIGHVNVNASDGSADSSPASEDVEMQTILVSCTTDDGPATGDIRGGGDECNLQTANDIGGCSSSILAENNDSLLEFLNFEPDPDIQSDINELSKSLEIGDSTSLYNDSNYLVRSSASCSQIVDSSTSGNLEGEELSYSFVENGDIPLDYDPALDLIQSVGNLKPAAIHLPLIPKADHNQLVNVQMTGTSEGSAKCQSVRVVRLDDNDGILRTLRGDNSGKKFFMMVLKPEAL